MNECERASEHDEHHQSLSLVSSVLVMYVFTASCIFFLLESLPPLVLQCLIEDPQIYTKSPSPVRLGSQQHLAPISLLGAITPRSSILDSCLRISSWFALDWGRAGNLLNGRSHSVLSTSSFIAETEAGSFLTDRLKMSAYSSQSSFNLLFGSRNRRFGSG